MIALHELDGAGVRAAAHELADVLHDCLLHGASVGFLPPFALADLRAFWVGVAQQVDAGARTVFVARDEDDVVCGTVQLALAMPANGAHRAEVNKMLVHTASRRHGIARLLMAAAEARARELGRTLLVLDTWTGSGAQHLYAGLGFRATGVIPCFARLDDGTLGGTTVMYKLLGATLDVRAEDPASSDAQSLLAELSGILQAITGDSGAASFDPASVRGPRAVFVIARDSAGRAVGCGALRPIDEEVAELKRMYARPGSGAGTAILAHLEAQAAALGYRALWLETRQVNARAMRFYDAQGYLRMPNYGRYVGNAAAACFGKRLASAMIGRPAD